MAHDLSLASGDLLGRARQILRQGDIALALGMIGILVVLILPVLRFLLDVPSS
jgi:flagellar biosynthesis component FlhA